MLIAVVCWLAILISFRTPRTCSTFSSFPSHSAVFIMRRWWSRARIFACKQPQQFSICMWNFQRIRLFLEWSRRISMTFDVLFMCALWGSFCRFPCGFAHPFLDFTTSGMFQRVWLVRWDESDSKQSGNERKSRSSHVDQKIAIVCTRRID